MFRNTLDPEDQELIRSKLSGMKGKNEPELIALFQRAAPANWTVQAIRESGIRSEILGSDSVALPLFMAADPELKEGVRVAQFFVPDPHNKRAREFVSNF